MLSCQSGLLYNAAATACDYSQNVKCTATPTTTATTKAASTAINTSLSATNTTTTCKILLIYVNSLGFLNENEISHFFSKIFVWGSVDPLCKGAYGVYPDPSVTDCSRFIKCDSTGMSRVACPSGLKFNKAIKVCDWPYNFVC